MHGNMLLPSRCWWWARFLHWSLFDVSKFSFAFLEFCIRILGVLMTESLRCRCTSDYLLIWTYWDMILLSHGQRQLLWTPMLLVFSILVYTLLSGRTICIALLCRWFPTVSATLWAVPSLVQWQLLLLSYCILYFILRRPWQLLQRVCLPAHFPRFRSQVDRPVLHHELSSLISYCFY
jgi:hypothetical protein